MHEYLRKKFEEIVNSDGLRDKIFECNVLGADFVKLPSDEYALMKGKEFLVDCKINRFHGQAFTDNPMLFRGRVIDVADMVMGTKSEKAVFFATLNAVLRVKGEIERTVHCIRQAPEECGKLLATQILQNYGKVKVAHIGFQPGHIKATSDIFDTIYITDFNHENVGKVKFGVKVIDGLKNEEVIRKVDVACISGSTIVNGTLFKLLDCCKKCGVKPIIYGVTIKGAGNILGYNIFCPLSQNDLNY